MFHVALHAAFIVQSAHVLRKVIVHAGDIKKTPGAAGVVNFAYRNAPLAAAQRLPGLSYE
jgi:hypothetical protein